LALSLATGLKPSVIHSRLISNNHEMNLNNNFNNLQNIVNFLNELNVLLKVTPTELITKGLHDSESDESFEVREKNDFYELKKKHSSGNYLLVSNNHIAFMKDGKIFDEDKRVNINHTLYIMQLKDKRFND
jgi:hypothetical protein